MAKKCGSFCNHAEHEFGRSTKIAYDINGLAVIKKIFKKHAKHQCIEKITISAKLLKFLDLPTKIPPRICFLKISHKTLRCSEIDGYLLIIL